MLAGLLALVQARALRACARAIRIRGTDGCNRVGSARGRRSRRLGFRRAISKIMGSDRFFLMADRALNLKRDLGKKRPENRGEWTDGGKIGEAANGGRIGEAVNVTRWKAF